MVYLHAAAFWILLVGILLFLKNIFYDYIMETKEDKKLEENYIVSLIIQIIGFSLYFIYYIILGSSVLSTIAGITLMCDIFLLFIKGANRPRFK